MPSLETVRLTFNYRCAPDILRRAQMCICHNPGPARALRPAAREGAPVRLVRADTAFSEAVWIAKEVARLAGGVDMLAASATEGEMRAFSEMAVLARTHRQLDLIEECLAHDGIPCLVAGREDYLEDENVRAALSFFRSLAAPADIASLRAALRRNWGLGEDALRRAVGRATPLERAEALRDMPGARNASTPWSFSAPQLSREKPERLLRRWIAMRGTSEAMERLASAASFHETMTAFLAALDLGEEADVRRRSGKARGAGAVTLMTLHGAKGLEFPVVFSPRWRRASAALPSRRGDGRGGGAPPLLCRHDAREGRTYPHLSGNALLLHRRTGGGARARVRKVAHPSAQGGAAQPFSVALPAPRHKQRRARRCFPPGTALFAKARSGLEQMPALGIALEAAVEYIAGVGGIGRQEEDHGDQHGRRERGIVAPQIQGIGHDR